MTNRRLALAGVVAALVGVAVWFVAGKVRSPDKPGAASSAGAMTTTNGLWRMPDRANADPTKDDPGGTMRLEGQVIDEQQQPVGAVTVVISSKPVRLATTEADGSFVFEGLLAQTYTVGAFKDGSRADNLAVRVRDDTEPVILRLRAGLTMAITVVDRDHGTPIAGAKVTASDLLEQSATTGADGVAELRGMRSWFNYVTVEAEGYGPTGAGVTLPENPGGRFEHTVELGRAVAVSGVVLDPSGVGMPRTFVEGAMITGKDHVGAETDANGRWTIPAVGAGDWVFTSPGEQHAPGASAVVAVDGVTAVDGVVIQLAPGARIAGIVRDAAGQPVPHASVGAASGMNLPTEASADADGRFDLPGLPRGTYTVVATEGDRASTLQKVDVTVADVTDLTLTVADATITGVVVDAAGEPVAEAIVKGMPENLDAMLYENTRAVTDSAGRWTMGPLSRSGYRLNADWPGGGSENLYVRREGVSAKPGDRDVKIVLPAAGTIRGVVVRAGAPVTRFALGVGEMVSHFTTPMIVTSPDGAFEREGLPPGTFEVTIAGSDFEVTSKHGVEVKAGEITDLGTIAVEAGRTVRGIVVDAAGAPVAGATVGVAASFRPRDGGLGLAEDPMKNALMNRRQTKTDADGRFELLGVGSEQPPPQVLADKRGVGRSAQIPLPDGDAELTLTLLATGAIVVTIEGGGDSAMVEAKQIDGAGSASGHSTGGHAKLEGLVPGKYAVSAQEMEPMRHTPKVEIEVTAGKTAPVTVAFPKGGITIVIETGAQCSLLRLMPADDADAESVAIVRCKPSSTVELDAIQPGDYRLCKQEDCKPITVKPSPDRQTFRSP